MKYNKKDKVYSSSETYVNEDDQLRNFTFIDCDVKTKISTFKRTQEEKEQALKELKEVREELLNCIFTLPPVFAINPPGMIDGFYEHCIKRSEEGISWDKEYVTNRINSFPLWGANEWGNTLLKCLWKGIVPFNSSLGEFELELTPENVLNYSWETYLNKRK